MIRDTRITRGGQISIPAGVRRRWATERVAVEDQGDRLVVRPLPADPIGAAIGSLRLAPGVTTDILRRQARLEDQATETRLPPAT
ncbi:MAG TPA: AbrB/MazE/SpoVT family DNA-binding domain-containing protein [Verrucomicrobiae bacterium]|nr:AbrB/MazE/SpoVT family DNA-binding domain-containing protein [Verrucomicrobiae bacterium]